MAQAAGANQVIGGAGGSGNVSRQLVTVTPSGTPTVNIGTKGSDTIATMAGLAAAVTAVTVTGTATDGQILKWRITDAGVSETLAGFAASPFSSDTPAVPASTTPGTTLYLTYQYNAATSLWDFQGYSFVTT